MGQPVVHFEVIAKDAERARAYPEGLGIGGGIGGTRMMGPDEPTEGVVVGLFQDPEGRVIGVTGRTG